MNASADFNVSNGLAPGREVPENMVALAVLTGEGSASAAKITMNAILAAFERSGVAVKPGDAAFCTSCFFVAAWKVEDRQAALRVLLAEARALLGNAGYAVGFSDPSEGIWRTAHATSAHVTPFKNFFSEKVALAAKEYIDGLLATSGMRFIEMVEILS